MISLCWEVKTPANTEHSESLALDDPVIEFSEDGTAIVLTSNKKSVMTVSLRDPKTFTETWHGQLEHVNNVRVLPRNEEMLVNVYRGPVQRIRMKDNSIIWSAQGEQSPKRMPWSTYSPRNQQVAMTDEKGALLFDAVDGSKMYCIETGDWIANFGRFMHNGDLALFEESRFDTTGNGLTELHIFTRRFPEHRWGHLYRPEVWLTFIFGVLILIQLIRRVRKSTA